MHPQEGLQLVWGGFKHGVRLFGQLFQFSSFFLYVHWWVNILAVKLNLCPGMGDSQLMILYRSWCGKVYSEGVILLIFVVLRQCHLHCTKVEKNLSKVYWLTKANSVPPQTQVLVALRRVVQNVLLSVFWQGSPCTLWPTWANPLWSLPGLPPSPGFS